MRRTLLYNFGVTGYSTFIDVAAVAVTTSVEFIGSGNIHLHNTQVSCVVLRLRSQPYNRRVVVPVALMVVIVPIISRGSCTYLVRRETPLGERS